MTLPEFLAHPFVLLIVGIVISSILVPVFSKRWQDRKKKLEIKIELITKISEVTASWELDTRAMVNLKERPLERNPNWRVKGSSITAILYAYFPTEQIYQKWKVYFNIIDQFWWFSNMVFHGEMKDEYKKNVDMFQNFLGDEFKKSDWDIFFNIQNETDAGKSGIVWSNLIDLLTKKQYDVVSSILDSKIKVF